MLQLYASTVNPKAKFSLDENDGREPGRLDEDGHLFAGYFFPYPDKQDWNGRGDGYVSTITDEPPQLNWIYVDKDTYEVKYGYKVDAEAHLVGPWNCTPIDKRLTFDGWEGFTVVEVKDNTWQLYYDIDDDGLEQQVGLDKRIMEIELTRKEMRVSKEDRAVR